MRVIPALLCWLSLLGAAPGAGAETFTAQVIVVLDGDTVMVLHDYKKTTIRLAGIDAPEKLQAFGPASRDALAALVLRKEVRITAKAVDDYGRVVGLVQAGNINVNEEQLRRGMAWEYSQYHSDKALIALQAEAQRARRGLWAAANPVPPWEFRKTHAPTREQAALATACGKKHYCSQMVSCDEARFYLTQCRVKSLDKNNDGVPCENLCRPKTSG
jgi:endonuclease YncB( thermonuclease family)